MRKITLIGILGLSIIAFAAVALAGQGSSCSLSKASAETASTCAYKTQTALKDVNVETTRLPSGALVVFYTSENPSVVQAMQTKAANGGENWDCGVCKHVAASGNCTVELGTFANGVVAFITSEDATAVDAYEKQFAALLPPADAVN